MYLPAPSSPSKVYSFAHMSVHRKKPTQKIKETWEKFSLALTISEILRTMISIVNFCKNKSRMARQVTAPERMGCALTMDSELPEEII